MVERSLCLPCWLKINKAKNRQSKGKSPNDDNLREEPSQKLDHLLFDTRDGWYRAVGRLHSNAEEDSTCPTFYDHCSH